MIIIQNNKTITLYHKLADNIDNSVLWDTILHYQARHFMPNSDAIEELSNLSTNQCSILFLVYVHFLSERQV